MSICAAAVEEMILLAQIADPLSFLRAGLPWFKFITKNLIKNWISCPVDRARRYPVVEEDEFGSMHRLQDNRLNSLQ